RSRGTRVPGAPRRRYRARALGGPSAGARGIDVPGAGDRDAAGRARAVPSDRGRRALPPDSRSVRVELAGRPRGRRYGGGRGGRAALPHGVSTNTFLRRARTSQRVVAPLGNVATSPGPRSTVGPPCCETTARPSRM